MPSLVVDRGNEKGVSLKLDGSRPTVLIGRLKECDLVLTDGLISRRHFEIHYRAGHYTLVDLNSHNGTYVNGERISAETELSDGTVIRAGDTLFVFGDSGPREEGALAGSKLGGYTLITRIGIGGMGEVYKAVQDSLGRMVALKILSPELTSDRSFVEKFLREARAAGKLNHPNVIQVHEVNEENGTYYFSMEYVDGGSVQDLISRGRKLEPQRAAEIVLQAAQALDYAEKAGIVHCDVKPDNLMLTANGEVRLADLGIAKTLNEKGKAEQTEGVFGSPHFMSPEQARGLPLDHRSDMYSLGVTFYRLVLGRVPFSGKDAKEVMEKQVFDEPESTRKADPSLPPLMHTIIARMMRKKPVERYPTNAVLIGELQTLLAQMRGDPLPAQGSNPRLNAAKTQKKPRNGGSGIWRT